MKFLLLPISVFTVVSAGEITPETFTFSGNRWFAEDRPDRSEPILPVAETGGSYGTNPR